MGCTASKSLEMQARMEGWSPPHHHTKSFARSFSMPLRKSVQQSPARKLEHQEQDLHIVALTSSTYGVLRIPDEEEQEESPRPTSDVCEKSGPISSEAPNSQLRGEKSEVKGSDLASVPEAEVIDLWELMKDLDEENSREEKKSSNDQFVVRRRGKNRMLSRSISSVDSIRELDVKIRSVALALPDLEKKLLALEALNSISKEDHQNHQVPLFLPSPFQSFGKNNTRQISVDSAAKLRPAKSMKVKGLFYGATIEDLRKNQSPKGLPIAQSSSTLSSCSSSSSSSGGSASSSYDASSSSGDYEESLFDPEVLKNFQQQPQGDESQEGNKNLDDSAKKSVQKKMRSSKVSAIEVEEQKLAKNSSNSLLEPFPAICPPRGENRVVIYVTSLRGIRKTFEDCGKVRMILQGFGVAIDERDVSMHAEFRQELKELLKVIPPAISESEKPISVPRLFVRGRYIGGIEEVGQLNEDGAIAKLVEGVEKQGCGEACEGCGGVRFVPCFECSGSCKVVVFGGGVGDYSGSGIVVRCSDCNENGLIRCPVCL